MFPQFSKVLYKDSPFLPQIETVSLYRLVSLTSESGFHPALATAHEVRFIVDNHGDLLSSQADWIDEKFQISEEETNLYYFGLFLPPTLILAADMINFVPIEDVLANLFPGDEDDLFEGLQSYAVRHLPLARRLLDLESPEPMISGEPIYAHCKLEVYSDRFWFLTGLEASYYLYRNLARLFESPIAPS